MYIKLEDSMIEYIKMIIISLISSVMMPLPVSSSAHTSFLNKALSYTTDGSVLAFYYAVFSLAFCVVVFFNLRKIYSKVVTSLFTSKAKSTTTVSAYKKVGRNILLSLIPLAILYIPVNDELLIIDYFDKFLSSSGLLFSAFTSIMSSFVIVIAMWYTKQKNAPLKRAANTKTVMRSAFYELVAFGVPGMSKITLGSVNMLICDIEPRVIMREVYLYVTPQIFIVSLIKIIRGLVIDLVVDPLAIIIGAVIGIIATAVIIHFVSRVNMRKLLGFFAAYSAVFSAATFIMSLV